MRKLQIEWTDEDQAYGESTLAQWLELPAGGRVWFEAGVGARALLQLQIAADELVNLTRFALEAHQGILNWEYVQALIQAPEPFLPGNDAGNQAKAFSAGEYSGVSDLYAVAQGSVLDVYRNERARDGIVLKLGPPPWESEQLSAGWVVPLIVVGGAALVASAWLISREVAPAWRSVETERAWAAAKAYSEIQTNKMLIASGQKPVVSDWSKLKAAGSRVQLSEVTLFGVGALAGVAGVAGAYYGLRSRPEPKRLPARLENPSRPRRGRPSPKPPRGGTERKTRRSKPKPKTKTKARKNPPRKRRQVDPRPIVKGQRWGHLKPPKQYAKQGATKRSDYAAPSAYMYPIHTAGHVKAARARFFKNAKRYPPKLRGVISRNIAKAEQRHGMSTNKPRPSRRPATPKRTRRQSTSKKKRTPGRDSRGRFLPSKGKRSPKGPTRRASRRGGKANGAGRKSLAK